MGVNKAKKVFFLYFSTQQGFNGKWHIFGLNEYTTYNHTCMSEVGTGLQEQLGVTNLSYMFGN